MNDLKIKLKSVEHPKDQRSRAYLFNMTDKEKEKIDILCNKYNLTYRQLFSQLIEKAK